MRAVARRTIFRAKLIWRLLARAEAPEGVHVSRTDSETIIFCRQLARVDILIN
jgi:hypothetical protein